MILLERVSKSFEGRKRVTALDDVNVSIPKGELVSIIGPSGSGKSTLLNLIGGLDRPTAGHITLDGERLDVLSDDRLTAVRRDKIGFIFQFFNLLPSLSCLENVALPLHLRGWPRKKIEARARELLELVKLVRPIRVTPIQMSIRSPGRSGRMKSHSVRARISGRRPCVSPEISRQYAQRVSSM